jgi:hypothetical protein
MYKIVKIFLLLLSFSLSAQSTSKSLLWQVKSTEWTAAHEKMYQEFVQGIGLAREKKYCLTLDQCLKHPVANKLYYSKHPKNLNVFTDCADLPYVLRAYFAWMNDLPFSYPNEMRAVNVNDPQPDVRYSQNGNKVVSRTNVKTNDSFSKVIYRIVNAVSSAMFRVSPLADAGVTLYPDFYSVKISKNTLVPGTVLYDPSGHILVIYQVTSDGRIHMIDAHPDGSLTRQVYGDKFVRSRPAAGAGFKAFRPILSTVVSGKTVIKAQVNKNLAGYGLEQYYGTHPDPTSWSKGQFILNEEVLGYYDYVRRILSLGVLEYHPLSEMTEMLNNLCDDFKDRVQAVQGAVDQNMHLRPHPIKLPRNIYGTTGEWESFSTPSRDARFKASAKEVMTAMEFFLTELANGNPVIKYEGVDLVSDLMQVYDSVALTCQASYLNSEKTLVTLNLADVLENRLFNLSFDPYHCPELRWGATGAELSTCKQDSSSAAWYDAEQNLRNAIDRNYDIDMAKSLEELKTSTLGVSEKPDVDVKAFLKRKKSF